jgi:16S rRNA (cytidine1402-2'-O)-methyltransferase
MVLGRRTLVVGRELTKIHEEFIRLDTAGAVEFFRSTRIIGEYTLLFGPPEAVEETRDPLADDAIWGEIARLTDAGKTRREAVAELAGREGRSSKDIYAAAERGKRLASSE